MTNLAGLTPEELEVFLVDLGQPRFRAKQVYSWIHKGVTEFSQMRNIPKALQQQLAEVATPCGAKILQSFASTIDETIKYLIQLEDGHVVEAVRMCYHHGVTVCISTEVGCAMGCAFCASTIGGLVRRLSAGEILAQVLLVSQSGDKPVSNIVLMGIGEPLDNYDEVVRFLHLVNDPRGIGIGQRHISLSTCGLVPQMDRLAQEGLGITLCVSLHAATDEKRSQIMPINRRYPLESVLDACRRYTKATGRRMIFEYALIRDENDRPEDARQLANCLRGLLCHVNLIPVNPIAERSFARSNRGAQFVKELESYGVTATIRRELGSDISASCGQLRRKRLEGGTLSCKQDV